MHGQTKNVATMPYDVVTVPNISNKMHVVYLGKFGVHRNTVMSRCVELTSVYNSSRFVPEKNTLLVSLSEAYRKNEYL